MAYLEEEQSPEFHDKLFTELEVDLECNHCFYCSRCGELVSHYTIPDEKHDCIECSECGEFNSCICDELDEYSVLYSGYYCQECKETYKDCICEEINNGTD